MSLPQKEKSVFEKTMLLSWKSDGYRIGVEYRNIMKLLQMFLDSSNIPSLVNIVLFETTEMEYRTVKP